jgi:putative spermidine/putrescine transport system ATP-binding protein
MHNLRVEGISKRYGSVVALEPTDLTVAAGEFLTLLGPSGSGKTTLLSLIAGLTELDSGRIVLNGRDISRAPAHERGLGVVFQNYALFPHMSVAENVAFGLQTRRLRAAEKQSSVRNALAMVRLEALAQRMRK